MASVLMPSHLYMAYGLTIRSSFALPELALAEVQAPTRQLSTPCSNPVLANAQADVVVRLAPHATPRDKQRFPWYSQKPHRDQRDAKDEIRVAREETVLSWRNAGRFRLRAGREVLIEPTPGVTEKALRTYLLGPVLSALLYQRGLLVLHASAVALCDANGQHHAVAFIGHSGEGKSTMAAALHARGHAVIADDFIAVPLSPLSPQASDGTVLHDSQHPSIFPGFPQLRLWPASLEALGENAQDFPSVHAGGQKRARHITQGFCAEGLPLRRLYVLGSGDGICSSPVHPAKAAISVVQHASCTGLLSHAESALHFQQCVQLARRVSVRQLQRPRDLTRLAQVAQIVEDDHALDLHDNRSQPAPAST